MRSSREALSLVDRVFGIFEDHAALAFEFRANDEIKIEVWHCSPLPDSNRRKANLSLAGSFITTLISKSDCSRLLRFGVAAGTSRA